MPLRCAVAGLNRGASFVKLFAANPATEVVAVCDPRPAALERVPEAAGYTDYDQMLAEARPDLVALITPGPQHAPQSLAALDAGAHVLCETPNVYSLAEAEAVVAMVRATGRRYMLAENYVFMGWCQRLREFVASGGLGEVLGGAAEYTHDCRGGAFVNAEGVVRPLSAAGEPGLTPLWRLSDLPPLAYCSHTLGPLLEIIADRCVSVSALAAGQHTVAGVEVYPLETALCRTEQGRTVTLTNGFMLSHPFGYQVTIYGTAGSVRLLSTDWMDASQLQVFRSTDDQPGWRRWELPWKERDDGRDFQQAMVDDFIVSIVEGSPPPFNEARSMELCLPGVLAHESARRGGETLTVPLFDPPSEL